MNRLTGYWLPSLLLSLAFLPAQPQETSSSVDRTATAQAVGPSPALTADGVPACPADSKPWPPPNGANHTVPGLLLPSLIKGPEAKFSKEGRKYGRSVMKEQHLKRFETTSLLRMEVDTDGLPKKICVFKEAGHGLDRKAFESVEKYRFKPATLNGKPVPASLVVEVKFALW